MRFISIENSFEDFLLEYDNEAEDVPHFLIVFSIMEIYPLDNPFFAGQRTIPSKNKGNDVKELRLFMANRKE